MYHNALGRAIFVKNIGQVITGRSSAWLERLLWEQEAGGSNPLAPIKA